jgi:hypothetical protein
VSQPFDRAACIPAPKEADQRLKDWWVENPWQINIQGKSLSGYERNRLLLNARGETFYDVSALTAADSEGDGRSVVAVDFTGDGMEDLIVRQAGGGPLLLFENRFPKAHWLRVSLRGAKSNRLGIGARLVAKAGGQQMVRELYPVNGFKAQGPAHVHLGLGQSETVDRLTVIWPSGLTQEFTDLATDRAILIREGGAQVEPAIASDRQTAAAR